MEREEEEPREPIPCRECGCLFVPSSPASRVCGDACRATRARAWQQRQRCMTTDGWRSSGPTQLNRCLRDTPEPKILSIANVKYLITLKRQGITMTFVRKSEYARRRGVSLLL